MAGYGFFRRNLKQIIIYFLGTIIALVFIAPFLWLIFTSLKTQQEVYTFPLTIIPHHLTFQNYLYIIGRFGDFGRFFVNSVVVTVFSVAAIVLLSSISGYALGRKKFFGRDIMFTFIMLILTVPYVMYLIPIFIMEESLNLRNSYIGLILPYVALYLPWGLFLMRGAFRGIPFELEEYARIDGASDFQIWLRVLMPLVKPGLATATIISFVFVWQEFLFAVSLQTESEWQTLPVGIVFIRDELQSLPYHNISTMIVVSLIPIFILFMIFKDFFIRGITEGAIKG
jgi:ABC-type glycerol-3-phosphate transport system permease component